MSQRLSHRQLARLNAGIYELHQQQDPDALKHTALAIIARIIGIDVATLDEVQADGSITMTTTPSTEHAKVLEVSPALAEHLHTHPSIPAYLSRDPRPVRMSDYYSTAKFKRTALFNEVYRPFGVVHQLNAMPPGPDLRHSAISLHRRGSDFTNEEMLTLQLLTPHLALAFRNALRWTEAVAERRLIEASLAAQEQTIILLDARGNPRNLSPAARQMLGGHWERNRWSGGLAEWIKEQRLRSTRGNRAPLPFRSERGEGVLEVRYFAESGGAEMLLLTERVALLSERNLSRVGLSRREAEVARWMAEGKSDSAIGIILQISEHTAHKHVQSILRKLGVSHRSAALLRIFELSGFR